MPFIKENFIIIPLPARKQKLKNNTISVIRLSEFIIQL